MESKLARIIKTFTFRLALIYVGLFSVSAIVLFTFIYTFAMTYLEEQTSESIRKQYVYLQNAYKEGGSSAIEERLEELINHDEDGSDVYMLVNRDYEKLIGNLNEWPVNTTNVGQFNNKGSWVRFYIESTIDRPNGTEVRALTIPLSKWRFLMVGQTFHNNQQIEQTIVQTFWASLFLTISMAFMGAIIMTRSVMQRINIINRSAETIMHGNLSVRIPFTKGGDEFDDLSSNLNEMLDKIEHLLASLSHFANNIAHDLRSPLTRIITRIEAGLRTVKDDNPARELLEENVQDLQELISTFNSILNISELEANTDFRHFDHCDAKQIITNLVEFYEPYASEKNVTISNSLTEAMTIYGEKNLLTQAFSNMLDNAIKFTPQNGTVRISGQRLDDKTIITIADSGPGIDPAFYDRVFEKFFRLEDSRNTKGNGLGLSLVSAVARIHNAVIELDDNHPGLIIRLIFNHNSRN